MKTIAERTLRLTLGAVVKGFTHRHCKLIQSADGYGYSINRADHTGREQVRPKGAQHTGPSAAALYLPGLNPGVSCASR